MRVKQWMLAAIVGAALPATAFAQDQTTTINPDPMTTQSAQTTATYGATHDSEWIASGFVGSNFSASGPLSVTNSGSSINFGGQIGYLWNKMIGAEFLADFSPRFEMNNALLSGNPNVNSYMVNAIGALPLGDDGNWQPYVSGGVGAIQLRSDMFNANQNGVLTGGTSSANQSHFGGDIGAGVMGFAGAVGLRGDVRYYRSSSKDVTDPNGSADNFASNLLNDLRFWRADIGVAFRW